MLIRNCLSGTGLAALVLLSACERKSDLDVEFITAPGADDLNLPFSPAVRVGHTLYLSGNLGNIPGTLQLAEGGIKGETRQTMENIKSVLKLAGSSMDKIVKCSVFIEDMAEWGAMNEVYLSYFDVPPARSALGSSGLALGAKVEIDCIAVIE